MKKFLELLRTGFEKNQYAIDICDIFDSVYAATGQLDMVKGDIPYAVMFNKSVTKEPESFTANEMISDLEELFEIIKSITSQDGYKLVTYGTQEDNTASMRITNEKETYDISFFILEEEDIF